MMYKSLLFFICSLLLIALARCEPSYSLPPVDEKTGAVLSKGSYTVDFEFSGGLSICTQCGAAGAYYCTNQPLWSPHLNFTDRTPVGSVVTGYKFSMLGSYGCQSGTSAFSGVLNNGAPLASIFQSASSDMCLCNTCDGTVSSPLVGNIPYGDPYMNLRGANSFNFEPFGSPACLASVSLEVFYAPPPAAFSSTHTSWSSGGAVGNCGWGQSFFNSGNNLFSFISPIPAGNLLLTVTAEIFLNDVSSNFNISMALVGTTTGSVAVNPSMACSSVFITSSAIYQDGWPSFNYNGAYNYVYVYFDGVSDITLSFSTLYLTYISD